MEEGRGKFLEINIFIFHFRQASLQMQYLLQSQSVAEDTAFNYVYKVTASQWS